MGKLNLPLIPQSVMFVDKVMTIEWQNFFNDLLVRVGGTDATNLDDLENEVESIHAQNTDIGLGPQAEDLDMNVHRIVAMVDPINEQEGATKNYADTHIAFGEIYASDVSDELTVTTAGQDNRIQITSFDTNGLSNRTAPDHTNDHIEIVEAGKYLCTVSMAISSAGAGGADDVGFSVYKNDGETELLNCHGHRKLAGGGTDRGSCSISGIIDLDVDDTIEVWVWNEDSTDNIIIDDITLSLVKVGV